jgi:hypothetical protein
MRMCAYCQEFKQMTKEHVFPESLIELFPEAKYAFLGNKMIPLSTEKHVVKDVCNHCNNVHLKRLDDIGVRFIKKYFLSELNPNEELIVSYDYLPLAKWIMKIIYNSSRQYKEMFHPWFRENSKFIIGLEEKPTSYFSLFLGFYVDCAPIKGMFPDKPFEVIMNPRLITSSSLNSPLEMYEPPNAEVYYLIRLGNAIFLFIVWNDQTFMENKVAVEVEIENVFPYTSLNSSAKATIYRSTDCINCGNLFMVHSRDRQKSADIYQMSRFRFRV